MQSANEKKVKLSPELAQRISEGAKSFTMSSNVISELNKLLERKYAEDGSPISMAVQKLIQDSKKKK